MALHKLEKDGWHGYFEHMSRIIEGLPAEVEVAAEALGLQAAALWLPLFGIVYEERTDMLEMALEGVDHMVRRPREIWVEEEALSLLSMEVVDAEGTRHLLRLRRPLLLPRPLAGAASGLGRPGRP